jgi:predicted alpha-1,6-mannanase (GH76 family)
MVTENYLVENGLNKNCEVSKGSFYTYNQGIILSALVEYYKIINENFLIELAHEIANATISNLVYEDGVLRDLKEPDLNGDASQFKGIFMRNLAYLHSFDPKENYKDFILLNADSIWNLARNKETNEIGVVWNSFSDRADASCQSSALDAFNAALIVTN